MVGIGHSATCKLVVRKDSNGDLSNLNLYQSGNRSDAAMKFLVTTGLDVTKPGVTKEKTRDKIGNMIALYKGGEIKQKIPNGE